MDRERASGNQIVGAVQDVIRRALQRVHADRRFADDEAFSQIDQVRRDVAGGAKARGDQRGMGHRGDRPLAVGAGDVERGERPLGMAERRTQARDVVEPELDPERLEREKAVEQR